MLRQAQDRLSKLAWEMDGMVARGRGAAEQERQVIWFGLGGILLGILLWSILPGAVARSLPVSWHVPEWMASRMMGMEQKEAGRRLIISARGGDKER